jgi:hypothetical protein
VIATYGRTGGFGAGPPEAEFLSVEDDGRLEIRRTTGTPAVGLFGGRLVGEDLDLVLELAAAAEAAGPVEKPILPDASILTVTAGSATALFGAGSMEQGAWTDLVHALEWWLDRRLDEPVAAVELVLGADGRSARLEQAGSEPVAVDLSSLAVKAVLWKGYYELVAEWNAASAPGADARMTVEPGWTVDVPFEHGLELGPGRTLHASATFGLAVRDGPLVPVLASVAPAIPYEG